MNKAFHNKKGQVGGDVDSEVALGEGEDDGSNFVVSSKIYHFAFILVLVILAFVAFVLISQNYVDSLAAVPLVLDRDLVITRMTNVCFAKDDPITGYPKQNVLDLSKVSEERFRECFADTNLPRVEVEVKSIYSDSAKDKPFEPVYFFTSKGGLKHSIKHYGLVYTKGKYYPAYLEVNME